MTPQSLGFLGAASGIPLANVFIPEAGEYKYEYKLPDTKPEPRPPSWPLKYAFGGKITFKGSLGLAKAQTKVTLTHGANQVDLEQSFKTEYCDIKVKEQVKPGQVSKLGIEIGRKGIPFSVEFAANADFTKPFTVSIKGSTPIEFPFKAGGVEWAFKGSITPQLDVHLSPNEAWAGWGPIFRAAAQAGRTAVQTGANAVRAVYFAGECGTVSSVGAAAVGASVGAAGVAWLAFGLYEIAKANSDGRAMAVRYAFSNGYARALAEMTGNCTGLSQAERNALRKLDWAAELSRYATAYINGANVDLANTVEQLGMAAVIQDADRLSTPGAPASWEIVSKKHQAMYGANVDVRRRKYLEILYAQVESKATKLSVPFL